MRAGIILVLRATALASARGYLHKVFRRIRRVADSNRFGKLASSVSTLMNESRGPVTSAAGVGATLRPFPELSIEWPNVAKY